TRAERERGHARHEENQRTKPDHGGPELTPNLRVLASVALRHTPQRERSHKKFAADPSTALEPAASPRALGSTGAEHQRIRHGPDAVFRRREGQAVIRLQHAGHRGAVRQIAAAVLHVADRAVATDHEARADAALEVRVTREPGLVAVAEASEVLAHDAL